MEGLTIKTVKGTYRLTQGHIERKEGKKIRLAVRQTGRGGRMDV